MSYFDEDEDRYDDYDNGTWPEGDYDVDPDYDPEDDLIDGVGFADPGGRSALRAATPDNPRDQSCPTCGRKNVLTRIDVQRHYVCDRCADAAEGIGHGGY
jgi:hypothetical protein